MKILILTDKLGVGGAETHIAQLAEELTKRENTVLVASSGGDVANRLEMQGITQFRMPLHTHSPLQWLLLHREIMEIIRREKIDVAHAHARIPSMLLRGARHIGCAEVVTVHAKFRAGFLRRILSNWGENSIAVSEDLRTYLHDVYKIPMQRITVIPNGIDLLHFSSKSKEKTRETLHILFASRLDADCSCGAELLCEIAPMLKEHISKFTITIVGGGEKMPEIAERAKKINQLLGEPCISLVGAVQDMAPLLQKQDIFVGVSRAALEAACCGCPVILCGNEGYGGILRGENFWDAAFSNFCARHMQPPNKEQLMQDLLELASSFALREKVALEYHKLLENQYNSVSVCEKTLDVYQKSMHKSSYATVVIGGYFGCGNLGDDAILQAFIDYTRTHYPHMRIVALTKKPRKDTMRFGVKCVRRKNIFALLFAFLHADAFLCGGGSLLQNVTGRLSLYYYLCMIYLAKMCGSVPVLYAAGIGPLHGKHARYATKKALTNCQHISLRDEESLRFLQMQNVDPAHLHLGADAAFLLSPPPISRTHAILHRINVAKNTRYMCICLKSGKHTLDTCRIIIAAARMYCRNENLLPVFLPLDKNDISINAQAAAQLGGKLFFADEPSDITAILQDAEILISMRLHGMILATTATLPSIGIPTSNDPKIPSFSRLAAQEYILPENLTVAALVEICQHISLHKETMRPLIADACRDLQKNAQKDLANIFAMVYNKGRYSKKSEETL